MKSILRFLSCSCMLSLVSAHAAQPVISKGVLSRTAMVDGTQIHYLTAGHGPVVVLIHGYPETSRMWRPLIPRLADRFTVIAPDLPGIGDSAIPPTGLDMKTAAVRIHSLVDSLGLKNAEVVGHDIGTMIAYAYAAQFPQETTKLVVMDAFLPGVAGWEGLYNDPNLWHFRFHGASPAKLVQGRERSYFDYYWNEFAANKHHSLSEEDREAYVTGYARQGRMVAAWAYFASLPQSARDFEQLSKTRLTMPVLSIGGEKFLGDLLGKQMKLVATNVSVIILKGAGHWIMEEKPNETMDALIAFL